MPVLPPDFWFGAPRRGSRIAAWFLGGFSLLMIGGGWWMVVGGFLKLRGLLPLNNIVDVLTFLALAGVQMLWVGMVATATVGLSTTFFRKEEEVAVNGRELVLRWRSGPYRRKRRVAAADVCAICLRAPATISERAPAEVLENRRVQIWLTRKNGKEICLKASYLYPIGTAAAHAISRQLNTVAGEAVPADGSARCAHVTIKDEINPQTVNEDLESETGGTKLVFEETAEGRRMYEPPGKLVGLLKWPVFRSGLWAVVGGIGFYFAVPLLPPAVVLPPHAGVVGLAFCGGWGVLMMGGLLYLYTVWISYEITPEWMIRRRHVLWNRRGWPRKWRRTDIAAIRISERVADEGRRGVVIELLSLEGKRVVIASGSLPYLRSLATFLRRELQVGADADVPRSDPTDPLWHLQDQTARPEKFPHDVVESGRRVVVSRNWNRNSPAAWIVAGLTVVAFISAAVLIPLIGLPHAKNADDFHAIWVASGLAALMALFLVGAIAWDILERWVIVADPNGISFTRRTLLGKKELHWPRETLRAVRTEAQFPMNPRTNVRIILVTESGEERLVTLKASAARFIATLMRRETGLPARFDAHAECAPSLLGELKQGEA